MWPNGESPSESAIWIYEPTSGQLTLQWVDGTNSTCGEYLLMYFANDLLVCTAAVPIYLTLMGQTFFVHAAGNQVLSAIVASQISL